MMEYELYETDKDELDITDEHAVSLFMHRNRPDVVINCAGYHPSAGAAQSETDMAYKVNAVGARNLAQSAESIQAKLIQISTDDVFSSASDTPYNEFDDVNPVGLFAKSKYAGEKFVIQLMTRYVIIRSSWIYGIGKDFLNEVLEAAADPQVSTMELLNNDRAVPTSAAELARVVKFSSTTTITVSITPYAAAVPAHAWNSRKRSCVLPERGPAYRHRKRRHPGEIFRTG